MPAKKPEPCGSFCLFNKRGRIFVAIHKDLKQGILAAGRCANYPHPENINEMRKTTLARSFIDADHSFRAIALKPITSMSEVIHESFHIINNFSYMGVLDPIGEGSDELYAYLLVSTVEKVSAIARKLGCKIQQAGSYVT